MSTYTVNAINNTTYQNCQNITSVDLQNIPWTNNSMCNAFYSCTNLQSVSNISNTVTNMRSTFLGCTKLVNAPVIPNSVTTMSHAFSACTNLVNAPVIPNSVTTMAGTFARCYDLVNAPAIPNSVTIMYDTFYNCSSLINAPAIPNSVTNMSQTFRECYNLVNAPEIPNSVTDMYGTFEYCNSLTSNIYILSNQITNATKCFASTTLTKNVYIPFYNLYSNKTNTTTYNSFITAGYKTNGTKEGVYLKNTTPTLTINPTPSDSTIRYTVGGNTYTQKSIAVPCQTTVAYAVSKSGYVTNAQTVTIGTIDQALNVTLQPEHPDNVTLTVNTDPADATVIFSTGTVSGKSCTIPYNTSVTYTISRTGYKTSDPVTITLIEDTTVTAPALTPNDYTVTFTTTPSDATITFNTAGTVSGKSITVPYGTVISYNISCTGYQSKNNQTYTCTKTETVTAPALDKNNYTFTVNTTPNDATVNFNTGTVSGHSVTVPYETTVTYTISKTGYVTSQEYTKTVTQNDSVDAPALVAITDPDYEFVIANDKADLTKYIGTAIDITVPDYVGTI